MARLAKHTLVLTTALAAALTGAAAFAQSAADIQVQQDGANTRILITYDETLADARPSAEVNIEHNSVLIASLSEPLEADVSELADEIGTLAARARLDPDGTALRIALNRATQSHVSASYNMVAIDLVPPGAPVPEPIVSPREIREREAAAEAAELAAAGPAAPPPADPVPVTWRTGQSTEYTRLQFDWQEPVEFDLTQTDDQVEVRFSKPAEIDLRRMSGAPPRHLQAVEDERIGDEWFLRLDLADDVRARAWSEGNRVVIDLLDPDVANAQQMMQELAGLAEAAAALQAENEALSPPAEPDVQLAENRGSETPAEPAPRAPEFPAAEVQVAENTAVETGVAEPDAQADAPREMPVDGIIDVSASEANGDLRAEFNWPVPVGAAVFRRGEAIWIVFDREADLDLEELGFSQRGHVQSFRAVRGPGYSAARIVAPETTQAEARQSGDRWTIVFSERIESPPRPILVRRDAPFGRPGRIVMDLTGANAVRWMEDPVVGDRIAAITSSGPIQGLVSRRDFIGGALFASSHGGAVELRSDDLLVEITGSGVMIGRPDGLDLTPSSNGNRSAAVSSMAHLSSPAYVDFDGWAGERRFNQEWPERQRRAARNDGPDDRIALARFLVAHELGAEALGMLETAVDMEPQLATDAHVRALRGVASYQIGRIDEAEDYLADSALVRDPAASLWRAMVAIEQERWIDARRFFDGGADLIYNYPPRWRARFYAAHARAAVELNDFGAAHNFLRLVDQEEPDDRTRLDAFYVGARLAEAEGNLDEAIRRLENLASSGTPPMEARAIYDLARLRLEAGRINRLEAIEELENLRFRWRGDTIELDTVRTLGELYVSAGAFSQGLQTMATAQSRFPETEAGRRIGDEMDRIFNRLFLEGEADRMNPIESVALFYQYQHLAPIGADGDRMIRRLADRLIAFDLLDPAAELLQHQVDYRLREPLARASVATDLAIVYLMDRQFEAALRTIRGTSIQGLPEEMVEDRYLLMARAQVELGMYGAALDNIGRNDSPIADRLRADISWEEQNWPQAGRRLESLLGNRYRREDPLTPSEQTDLVRAAIAYSLAGDRQSSLRLGDRYGEAMARTNQAAAFEVLTDSNTPAGTVRLSDLSAEIAGIDTLDAFMEPFRERFNNASSGPS